jgi:hypothetical protein
LISRLAIKKGETNDELKRDKERARKTMNQLKNTKKVDGTMSPSRTMKGQQTATMGGTGIMNEESPINLLLFSNMQKSKLGNLASTSFANTMNTMNSG